MSKHQPMPINPRILVDFNEMPSPDEVLLSQHNTKLDSSATLVELQEGAAASVYCPDIDHLGRSCNLIADGVVVRNTHDSWTSAAKWLLKIDKHGIRHESEAR